MSNKNVTVTINFINNEDSKLEKLAKEIMTLLNKYNSQQDVAIYLNGKRFSCDEKYWTEEKGFKGSDYSEYANDETITMTFEGKLYEEMNYFSASRLIEELDELFEEYGYYYELGNAWNLSLHDIN